MKRSTATDALKEAALLYAEAVEAGSMAVQEVKALCGAAHDLWMAKMQWQAWQHERQTSKRLANPNGGR